MRNLLQKSRYILLVVWISLGCFTSLFAIDPPDLGADTTLCGGIMLDAGPGYASYQWSTAIGDTNQTVLVDYFPGQSRTLTVFVLVTDSLGDSALDSIHLVIHPVPMVDLGMDRVACDSLLLNAKNPGWLYLWQDGSTPKKYMARQSGSYWVQVWDSVTLCAVRDTISLTVSVSPIVDLGPDGVYCDIVMIDFGPSHQLSLCNGTLLQTLIITNANEGTFCIEVSDINGCSGRDTITVEIVDQQVIGFSEMATPTDSSCRVIFTNQSTGEDITYSWDFGDGSPQVTTRDAVHDYQPGHYQVCLTIINACDTLTQCISLSLCVIWGNIDQSALAAQISLFPSPTSDRVSIEFTDIYEEVSILLFDLKRIQIPRYQLGEGYQMDLSMYSTGIYGVQVWVGDEYVLKQVMKQ